MDATRPQVEDALDSVPATDGVLVVQVEEDGSIKKLADRQAVPNYPGHIIVLNSKEDAAARLRTASRPVSRPSRPDPPAESGDTPTDAERP